VNPRPWIALSSSTGRTLATLVRTLSPEARASLRGLYTDRECGAPAALAEVRPDVPHLRLPRKELEKRVLEDLRRPELRDALVLCCGYFAILSKDFVENCPAPLVNTHPSLLPAFPGLEKSVHEQAARQVAVSGFTVHLITAELDGGPILFQHPVWLDPALEPEALRESVRAAEQHYLPQIWDRLLRTDLRGPDRDAVSSLELRRRLGLRAPSFKNLDLHTERSP